MRFAGAAAVGGDLRKRREEIRQKGPLKDWKSLLLPSG